jgi:hypothetical protein
VLKVHVLKTTGRRKRSEHRKYDLKQRAKIGKWVCDFGNIGAVRHFTSEFGKPINESTVIFMRKKNTIYRFVTSIFERDRVCLIRSSHICQ